MKIAEVIGRVTLSRGHPAVPHPRFLIGLPLSYEAVTEGSTSRGESLVIYDELGASAGALIGVSEGREAANPFHPELVPVDAYCACLLDRIHVERER